MERLEAHRLFFARLVTAKAGVAPGSELAAAFASTPREHFVGPPPWKVSTMSGYIETPTDDPTFLYQDIVVALGTEGPLNNGEPTLHASCLSTLALKRGERVVHVGAGTGYYTTILAKLVGEEGTVDAYEIDTALAKRTMANLARFPHVAIHHRSGSEGPLPPCDVLYVNAGATGPLPVWLDALKPGGRLLFPLTPGEGFGAMLLITRQSDHGYRARFLFPAQFVPCIGARNDAEGRRVTEGFRINDWREVNSLHRDDSPDESCWCSGFGWWLSTESLPNQT
jgi:protein-L-isoaspartate(D-aspartate) O-methyltransferase